MREGYKTRNRRFLRGIFLIQSDGTCDVPELPKNIFFIFLKKAMKSQGKSDSAARPTARTKEMLKELTDDLNHYYRADVGVGKKRRGSGKHRGESKNNIT